MIKLPNLRFTEIFHELDFVEDYINQVESYLSILFEKEKERAELEKQKCGEPLAFPGIEDQLDRMIEDVLPRYLRNTMIVTLWAIFESAVLKIAKDIKGHLDIKIKINEIRGDFLERTKLYFNCILDFPIDVRGNAWPQLKKLYLLRNAIAHANGNLENVREEDRKVLVNWADESDDITIPYENIVCSSDYIVRIHSIVLKYLKTIRNEVSNKYPESHIGYYTPPG